MKNLFFFNLFGSKTDLSKLGKISELKQGLPSFCAKILEQITAKQPSKTTGQQNSANLTDTANITFTY